MQTLPPNTPLSPVEPAIIPLHVPSKQLAAGTGGVVGNVGGAEQQPTLRLPAEIWGLLRCPRCAESLEFTDKLFVCQSADCEFHYPLSQGVPILVDPEKSVFDLETFQRQEPTFFRPVSVWREKISSWLPDISRNVAADQVYQSFRQQLLAGCRERVAVGETAPVANVLVVGGGVTGSGMECLLDDPQIRLIETDAAVAPRTQLICDAHDLPFADSSIDGVIVQAVLEHVVDPQRCVAEIHRVLKPTGLVYSDTPFMQQVHGRQYDFTRFTRLGHRRLFRNFAELDSGMTCGPGMGLAWSLRYFAMSFSDNPRFRAVVSAAARCSLWWLACLDPWLCKRESANDAASAFYFLGSKSDTPYSDRELLASYRGGQGNAC